MSNIKPSSANKVAFAAFIGTTIEWYDFYIYSLASVLFVKKLFFPVENEFLSFLGAFLTFALGFLVRPIGGLIFGYIGDRYGRKRSLVFTLMLMGIATTCVGLLPTYNSAGIVAPILLVLLRMIQGIAVGGEWGGAILLTSEHARKGRKNFFASIAQWGSPAGNVLALLVLSSILSLPEELLYDKQYWRIPFLVSFVLLFIGLFARFRLTESPVFLASEKQQEQIKKQESLPIVDVFKKAFPILILSIGANVLSFSGIFSNTIMISYTTKVLKVNETIILDALFWVAIVHFVSQPIVSYFSERMSASLFLIINAVLAMCSVFLLFPIIELGTKTSFIIGISLLVLCYSGYYGIIAGYLSRVFPVRMRYTGLSISYQGCAAIFGSVISLVGGYLIFKYQDFWLPLALFYAVLAIISIVSIILLERYYHQYDE